MAEFYFGSMLFIKFWKEKVEPVVDIKATFKENNILHLKSKNKIAIVFSEHLARHLSPEGSIEDTFFPFNGYERQTRGFPRHSGHET